MKVATGYLDGIFRPEEAVTRFEFAKMLASALGHTEASRDTNFSDNRDIRLGRSRMSQLQLKPV
ncbi:S-layer homology domain-containing protein [Paenibacillus pinisoli]|uniref:S-layer homology domain-containing protein n=1 Tax=Paenibacillus pinisoli TaxID=1276110 RepID=A0A3A6PZM0_9BACL|nr:S-layer homology domain-containing protein [Paenibacillus pinisoli]RJX39184.1 S-layer homology domain-containing protein [Paenibacillus pinisoli]